MAGDDTAWDGFLAALADPRRRFAVAVFGHQRFAGEWDMGDRVLPEHMLHAVHQGGHVGSVAGRPLKSESGTVLWVPPGTRQVLRQQSGPFVMHFLRFTVEGAEAPPGEPPLRRLPDAYRRFSELYGEWTARLPGREARLRALLVLLFTDWRRAARVRPGLDERQRARLLALVDRRPEAHLGPAALAREVGLSPTWFARLFRRDFGCAPRTWLLRRRIEHAAQRLRETDLPVGAVAAELGWQDLFLFSRQFRAVMGVPPREWRRPRA